PRRGIRCLRPRGKPMRAPACAALALILAASAADAQTAKCDGIFHWVDVPGSECLDGTQTGFQYLCQTGSPSGPLLVNIDGGGACWDGPSCDCQPDASGACQGGGISINHFQKAQSSDGLAWAQSYFGGAVQS